MQARTVSSVASTVLYRRFSVCMWLGHALLLSSSPLFLGILLFSPPPALGVQVHTTLHSFYVIPKSLGTQTQASCLCSKHCAHCLLSSSPCSSTEAPSLGWNNCLETPGEIQPLFVPLESALQGCFWFSLFSPLLCPLVRNFLE